MTEREVKHMLVLRDFRADQNGSVWAGLLVLALLGAAAAGAYIVVYQGHDLTVEARVYDVDTSQDPITAKFDLRLTNAGSQDIVLDQADVTVWADAGRSVLLTSGHVSALQVRAGGEPAMIILPVEIHNAGALGPTVWVDYHATWWRGSDRQTADVTGREVSVGDALSKLA